MVAVLVLHTWVALLMIVLYLLAFELKVAVSLSDGVLFHLSLNWLRSCSSESFSSFNKRSHSSRISVFLVNRSGSSSINFLIHSVPPASLTADDFSFNDCGSSFPEEKIFQVEIASNLYVPNAKKNRNNILMFSDHFGTYSFYSPFVSSRAAGKFIEESN